MLSCLALLQLSILNLKNQIFSSCCTIPPIPLYLGHLKRRREAKERDEEGKREIFEDGERESIGPKFKVWVLCPPLPKASLLADNSFTGLGSPRQIPI